MKLSVEKWHAKQSKLQGLGSLNDALCHDKIEKLDRMQSGAAEWRRLEPHATASHAPPIFPDRGGPEHLPGAALIARARAGQLQLWSAAPGPLPACSSQLLQAVCRHHAFAMTFFCRVWPHEWASPCHSLEQWRHAGLGAIIMLSELSAVRALLLATAPRCFG